jgi:hypothetical protein
VEDATIPKAGVVLKMSGTAQLSAPGGRRSADADDDGQADLRATAATAAAQAVWKTRRAALRLVSMI